MYIFPRARPRLVVWGRGVCLSRRIRWLRNASSIKMGCTRVYSTWRHKWMDCVDLVVLRLVWGYPDLLDPNATFQWYEESPMGGNQNVWNFWMNKNFYLVQWELLGWADVFAWRGEDILGYQFMQSGLCGSMQPCIFQIGPTCTWWIFRFSPRGYGALNMFLPEEGFELLQVISFYRVTNRRM